MKNLNRSGEANPVIEAIALLDKNGIIQYVSPFIYELLGYRPEELEKTEGLMLLYQASMQRVKSLYNELQQHFALMMEGLLQFRKKNGEKTGLYVHASNLLNHPGINGILVHLRRFDPEFKESKAHSSLIEHMVKINIDVREKVQQEIAAELHDHINPTLIAVKLFLDYLLKDPDKNFSELERISQILTDLIRDIRNLSQNISIKSAQDFELNEALHVLFENFRKCKALRLVLKYDRKLEAMLTHKQKVHLLRILQEQIANIIKHAKATKALISLQYVNGKAVVTTRDNGKGFEPDKRRSGIGLSNMLYRVNDLGGNIHIRSKVGEGTMIEILFPVESPN